MKSWPSTLLFLYARVLEKPLDEIGETICAKRPPRLPVELWHLAAMALVAIFWKK